MSPTHPASAAAIGRAALFFSPLKKFNPRNPISLSEDELQQNNPCKHFHMLVCLSHPLSPNERI